MSLRPADRRDASIAPSLRPSPADRREYDGVICFGAEDWWYHNRGHYDFQMMRELSRDVPVLYVNSIGVRLPSAREGWMFLRRIARKLKSLRRGLVQVRDNFAVFSPLVAPGRIGGAISSPWLAPQVRRAARKLGIRRPLVWVACPTAAGAVNGLDPVAVVYQRTDRHECYDPESHDRIASHDQWLKARADLTVFCANCLLEEEDELCRRARLVDHGVDFDRFAEAGVSRDDSPDDIRALPRPRVGFVGGIDAHTFDPSLFLDVAQRLDDVHFVLVGACSLPAGWCALPNVSLLGRRPYECVADYMAACDVLIMPWNDSRWIQACNPVKLKEYLAVGRPVVSTPFPELERYRDHVRIARGPDEFARSIRWALQAGGDLHAARERVREETWPAKASALRRELDSIGVHAAGSGQLLQAVRSAPIVANTPDHAVSGGAAPQTRHLKASPDVLAVIGAAVRDQAAAPRLRLVPGGPQRDREAPLDLDACIALAGGLEPSPLARQADCSVLDLALSPTQTVLGRWIDLVRSRRGGASTPVRVIGGGRVPRPTTPAHDLEGVSLETEPRAWRGPAGTLRDACRAYSPDATILIVEGARCIVGDLEPLLEAHRDERPDITIAVNPDGSPAGLYVVRAGVLSTIADLGFVDLKEQWLAALRDSGRPIRVQRLAAPGALPIRTLEQLLAAARLVNAPDGADDAPPIRGLVRGRAAQGLRVICPGALLGPGATVIDSIVMPGAVVAPDATIVRSLICPGARIQPQADIADAIVSAPACLSDHG